MALVPCRECSREISDQAEACPHCGIPDPWLDSVPQVPASQRPEDRSAESGGHTQSAGSAGRGGLGGLGSALFAIVVLVVGGGFAGFAISPLDNPSPTSPVAVQAADAGEEGTERAETAPQETPEEAYAELMELMEGSTNPIQVRNRTRRFVELFPNAEQTEELQAMLPELERVAGDLTSARVQDVAAREPEGRRPAVGSASTTMSWSYTRTSDPMADGVVRRASIRSWNEVRFSFPYEGVQRGRLTVRDHPTYGRRVIFSIERGHLLCSSPNRCAVRVRFDDGPAQTWQGVPPADMSTETIFFRNYSDFVQRIRNAQVVRIQPRVYQEGSPVFQFYVAEFDYSRYRSG